MILLRQRNYAAQDLAGATTANEISNIKSNRSMLAGLKRLGHRRNQRWLGRQEAKIAKMGLNDQETKVARQNILETYNKKNQKMQGNASKTLDVTNKLFENPVTGNFNQTTTKNTPTNIYQTNNTPKPNTQAMTTPAKNGITTGAKAGQFMRNNAGKLALGAVGQSGGGNFTVTQNKTSAAQQAVQAQQAHGVNENRVWADKNKYANLKKQGQAFNQGQKAGFQQGQQSVGFKQGAINTWNNMGTVGKIATGTALVGGALAIGTAFRKRREAERELEREKARNGR